MSIILNIETSTTVCSAALANDHHLLSHKINHEEKAHAALLTVMINQIFEESSIKISQLDAVAVSRGPGSYTGLRIGTSVAKGICYMLDIPLISCNPFKAMCLMFSNNLKNDSVTGKPFLVCPMIDARRMEVYSQLFDHRLKSISGVKAEIITAESYKHELSDNLVYFIGNGAKKCKNTIISPNALFDENIYPDARFMIDESKHLFEVKTFENTAYFEPFYLKDYIAGKPKNFLTC